MLKNLVRAAAAAWLLVTLVPAGADAGGQQPQMTKEQFLAKLHFKTGKITLPNGIATLDLPPGFRYLDPQGSKLVLVDLWGNPPSDTDDLGMIFPSNIDIFSRDIWGVEITYRQDGHVNDSDASKIDYGDLLKQMKEGMAEQSKERVKQGYDPLTLAGWAETPHYDQPSHKLYWALDLVSKPSDPHTLNYKIRVLGRRGVLVLNAIAGMDQLATIKGEMQKVVGFTDFTPGNRYSDFNSHTDKVAEYGIAALIAGGVAAKLGLFAKLFAVLLAAKKAILVGVVALFGGLRRMLGLGKKKAPPPSE